MVRRRCLLAAAAAVALALDGYQRLAERRDAKRFPPPGELIDIGGRRVHVLRSGTGGPVVVVLPGLSASALEWVRVQRAVVDRCAATVLVIDKGGIGWSDPAPWPRTPATMADELDALLTALRITAPVILAGHSMGGLAARVFAARHRERVAHLVLIDSSHEDQADVLPQFSGTYRADEMLWQAARWRLRVLGLHRLWFALGGRAEFRRDAEREAPDHVPAHLARGLTRAYRRAVVQESLGFRLGMRRPRLVARNLGELPVTVITAGGGNREDWYPGWCQLQANLLTMSTRSTQRFARHSRHNIQQDDPELLAAMLVDVIRDS